LHARIAGGDDPARVGRSLFGAALFLVAIATMGAVACTKSSPSAVASDAGVRAPLGAQDAAGVCHDNNGCGADAYCEFNPGLCGKGQKPGTCRPRPSTCTASAYAPVCGCDQKVYDNQCAAHAAGADLAVMGRCGGKMPNWIPCGKQFCDVRKDYCAIYLSDVFDIPTDYFCRPLPPSCLPGDGSVHRNCDCFPPGTPCLSFCGPMVTEELSGFHLTCQGVRPPRE
jgi:hypothetical protein